MHTRWKVQSRAGVRTRDKLGCFKGIADNAKAEEVVSAVAGKAKIS